MSKWPTPPPIFKRPPGIDGAPPSACLWDEWWTPEDRWVDAPMYRLQDLKEAFFYFKDFTEYKPAMAIVGDWNEYERMKRASVKVREAVEEIKKELQVLLLSEAQSKIVGLLSSDKPGIVLAASKTLADWHGDKRKVGRPSKSELEAEKKKLLQEAKITEDDLARVKEVMAHGRTEETVQ